MVVENSVIRGLRHWIARLPLRSIQNTKRVGRRCGRDVFLYSYNRIYVSRVLEPVSLAIAAVAQLWAIKVLSPRAHWDYKNAPIVTGFAVGLLVWGAMFLLLRRVCQDSDTRSDYRHE
jgi:hypothetical protein